MNVAVPGTGDALYLSAEVCVPQLIRQRHNVTGGRRHCAALFTAVAYIRAAASKAGVPVRQACHDLGERLGHPAP
jgi:hypothetical protein